MYLDENPFYLLNVNITDNRRKILSKSEELELLLGSGKATSLINTLITPAKRLSAEIGWFIFADDNTVSEIRDLIRSDRSIPTPNLKSIDQINAIIYDIEIYDVSEQSEMISIVEILDEQMSYLDLDDVTERINALRERSGFPSVSVQEVGEEVTGIRESIRKLLEDITGSLSENDYVEFVTKLADKYNKTFSSRDCAVIRDVIDQYSLRMNSRVDEMTNGLYQKMRAIKRAEEDNVPALINDLISALKEWDRYAQPLQIKAMTDGTIHQASRDLAKRLREFALELNDDMGFSDEALLLVECMQSVFSELTEMAENLDNLKRHINSYVEGRKTVREYANKEKEKRGADLKYRVVLNGDEYVTPKFCTCCMKETERKETVSVTFESRSGFTNYKRTLSVSMPICDECMRHRDMHKRKFFTIDFLSLFVGGVAAWALSVMSSFESTAIGFLSMFIALLSFLALSYVVKAPELEGEHSSRGSSVKIIHGIKRGLKSPEYYNKINESDEKWGLEFSNWAYAQHFLMANKSNVYFYEEVAGYNSSARKTILTSGVSVIGNLVATAIISVFAFSFFSSCIIDNNAKKMEEAMASATSSFQEEGTKKNSESGNGSASKKAETPQITNEYPDELKAKLQKADEVELEYKMQNITELENEWRSLEKELEEIKNEYSRTGDESLIAEYDSCFQEYEDVYDEYKDAVDDYNSRVKVFNEKYANQ